MIETLYPNLNGTTIQHTAVGDTPNWKCVDEASPDSDTTYNETASGLDGLPTVRIDLLQIDNPTAGLLGTISNVRVEVIAKYFIIGLSNKLAVGVRSAGSNDFKSDNDLTGTYDTYTGDWATNPITGIAWTWADILALQIGYRTTVQDDTLVTTSSRITRARAIVTAARAFAPGLAGEVDAYAMTPDFVHPSIETLNHIGLVFDLRARVPVKRGLTPQ